MNAELWFTQLLGSVVEGRQRAERWHGTLTHVLGSVVASRQRAERLHSELTQFLDSVDDGWWRFGNLAGAITRLRRALPWFHELEAALVAAHTSAPDELDIPHAYDLLNAIDAELKAAGTILG